MSKTVTATQFRKDMYRILGHVLESGESQEVELKGERLVIQPAQVRRDLSKLPQRKAMNCTFDELVATTWAEAWNPDP